MSAADRLSMPPQLLGDFHRHRLRFGHDAASIRQRFRLGVQGVRVGEETFFGSASRGGGGGATAVDGRVVGETEGGSFELGFGGFVVVAEVGQAGFADSYLVMAFGSRMREEDRDEGYTFFRVGLKKRPQEHQSCRYERRKCRCIFFHAKTHECNQCIKSGKHDETSRSSSQNYNAFSKYSQL